MEVTIDVSTIVSAVCVAITTILGAWFAYNQKTKDAKTEQKINKIEEDRAKQIYSMNRHSAIIYGELWKLLYEFDADRVYILQPHPEKKYSFLSVVFEVTKNGVFPMKDIFKSFPMSDFPLFSKELATNQHIFYDYNKGLIPDDKKALITMKTSGSVQTAIFQLNNINNDWVGNLFVERTAEKEYDIDKVKEFGDRIVQSIQYILPPIN